MLDDLNVIAQKDPENALALAAGQADQLRHSEFSVEPVAREFRNVVLAGMGGSPLGGLLCRSWWEDRLKLPFVISRDYTLPGFVDQDTLAIISSHSGNTEETLSSLADAEAKGAHIVVMASGGKLLDIAKDKGYPLLQIPAGFQPRMSVWFTVRALADLIESYGLVEGAVAELEAAAGNLEEAAKQWLPQVETANNEAKKIAVETHETTPIIYGSPLLGTAAYKWKISFNESAKNTAWCDVFPEFNHNEFIGWTVAPEQKPFSVIELHAPADSERITQRFQLSSKLLSGKMPKPVEVMAKGESLIEQILYAVMLGDFVSLYAAVLNGVNPVPVDLVEKLKKELG